MSQRNSMVPVQPQPPQFADSPSIHMSGGSAPPNADMNGLDARNFSALSQDRSTSYESFPTGDPSSSTKLPEPPKPRSIVTLAKLSGGVPIPAETSVQGVHVDHKTAWRAAEASANAKKAELEEQARLAGNPSPNVTIFSDAITSTFTIAVDYVFRWCYQVDDVQADRVKIQQQAAEQEERHMQSFKAVQSECETQHERQDTPAQTAAAAAEFMRIKQELGYSPPAAFADFMTSVPEDHGSRPQPNSTVFDLTGLDEISASFEIPPEPTTSDFEGDTVADDDSLFGDNVVADDDSLFGDNAMADDDNTVADDDSLFGDITVGINQVGDTGAASPEVTSEPALLQHLKPELELQPTAGADVDIEDLPAAQPVVGDDQATQQHVLSDAPGAIHADVQASVDQVFEPKMDYGTPCVGLYLTLTYPPAPAVTYRIQLNTALGQAQSDMKLIVTNELMKAQAQGIAEDLELQIDVCKTDIVNKSGTRLSYEIVEGTFAEGRFTSSMELDGRVVDGESYTRKMFEKAMKETERIHRESLKSHKTAIAIEEIKEQLPEELPETLNTKAFEASQELATPATEVVQETSVKSPQCVSTDQDVLTTPPSEVESPRASRIESQDKSPEQQQPTPIALHSPIKKRSREPESTEAFEKPPANKARLSPTEPTQESTTQIEASEATTQIKANEATALIDGQAEETFCRCKQPDDGTDMLGCDGESCCNNGWVHMGCFPEIKSRPVDDSGESKWYCPNCDPKAFEVKKKAGKNAKTEKRGGVEKKAGKKAKAVTHGAVEKKKVVKKGSAASKRKLIL